MKATLSIVSALLCSAAALPAENWPCFRGPTRQGNSAETGLPLKWSADENVAWKTAIPGEGWSSPIVWGERIFVTTATDNGTGCRALAIKRQTGKILWDTEVFKQVAGHKQQRNGYATPTPCTDGERVYTVFGDGSFAALDFEGRTVWVNRDFPFYGEHGLGTSPILWEDLLIMARDGSHAPPDTGPGWHTPWDQAYLVALDKQSGMVRWKASRGLSRIAHVVPNVWKAADGHQELISGAGDVVQGFDPKTGERLWSSKNIGEGVVPSIVIGDGLAFTASGWGGRESIKAFRLGGKGDLGESNLVWEQRKDMPRIPSYLYVKPYLYLVNEGGIAKCCKGDTGDVVWQQRLGGHYSASPVSAEGRIYFLSDEGETTVIEAGPEFKVQARNLLDEKAQASIAVSQGRFFIRTAGDLFCIGGK
jgi:outer membrane protein assembly factor BamB